MQPSIVDFYFFFHFNVYALVQFVNLIDSIRLWLYLRTLRFVLQYATYMRLFSRLRVILILKSRLRFEIAILRDLRSIQRRTRSHFESRDVLRLGGDG